MKYIMKINFTCCLFLCVDTALVQRSCRGSDNGPGYPSSAQEGNRRWVSHVKRPPARESWAQELLRQSGNVQDISWNVQSDNSAFLKPIPTTLRNEKIF